MAKTKTHVKAGDEVVLIAGEHKGTRARVKEVFPRRLRVLLEALEEDEEGKRLINVVRKAERPRQDGSGGGVVEREGAVHISNVMKADKFDARRGGGE